MAKTKKKSIQLEAIEKDLTTKQLMFCKEYMIDFNGKQSAIRAGYSESGAASAASRLLTLNNVQKELARLSKKVCDKIDLTAETVLRDIKEIKERCMQGKPVKIFDHEEKRMVESGEWEFEANAALKACDMEGKFLKMWSDKRDVEVKVTIEDLVRSKREGSSGSTN